MNNKNIEVGNKVELPDGQKAKVVGIGKSIAMVKKKAPSRRRFKRVKLSELKKVKGSKDYIKH